MATSAYAVLSALQHRHRESLSRLAVGLDAGAPKPRVNPGSGIGPQLGPSGEQRGDFKPAQLPPLIAQLREGPLRGAREPPPQLFIRQEAADDSLNGPM